MMNYSAQREIPREFTCSLPPPSLYNLFVLQKQRGLSHELLSLLKCKRYAAQRLLMDSSGER